jgi:hypothetical protein
MWAHKRSKAERSSTSRPNSTSTVFFPRHAHMPNLYPSQPRPLYIVGIKVSLKYLNLPPE